jgi:dihydroneopterin aldolase
VCNHTWPWSKKQLDSRQIPSGAPNLNTLIIENLSVETLIGCLDWEQTQPQQLLIDLKLQLKSDQPCLSDDLKDYVDYGAVVAKVRAYCKDNHTQMLEHLAEIITINIFKDFPIAKATVKLCKPHFIAEMGKVSVEITRVSASKFS